MTADGSGGGRSVSADLEFAGQHLGHALVVHGEHHHINRFAADLKSPASAGDGKGSGGAPSGFGAARGQAASVTSAENESDLDHGRDHSHAFGGAENFFRDPLVRGPHDFIQHSRRSVQAFYLFGRLIFRHGECA